LDKLSYTDYGFAKYNEQELLDFTKRTGFDAELYLISNGTFLIKAVKNNSDVVM
jgi:hypothetical protein